MSGGVDSSVAAALLVEQGYEVHGLFMDNWEDDDSYCTSAQDYQDARKVAEELGIPLLKANFATEYKDRVFQYFLEEYRVGRTPNPDVLCNREVKFKAFFDYAMQLGADYIATGHYCRVRQQNGQTQLLRGVDSNKDQTYFLTAVTAEALSKTLFPVGELPKPEVRRLAENYGFLNFDKKDSTGICFIGERNFREFLQQYLPAQPGDIIDENGIMIGQHQGLMYYTIGQRQGLGIGGVKNRPDEPWFVAEKNLQTNQLIVVQGHAHPLLLSEQLTAIQPHWINKPDIPSLTCTAKTRYRQIDEACTITGIDTESLTVSFAAPQRAITPGQWVVFYQAEQCLGGAVIQSCH